MTPERIHNVILLGPSHKAGSTARNCRDREAADRSRDAHLRNFGGPRLVGRWIVRDHTDTITALCGPMGRAG